MLASEGIPASEARERARADPCRPRRLSSDG